MESQFCSYMSPNSEYWRTYQHGIGVLPGPMMEVMYPVAEPMVANNGNNRTSPGGNGNSHSSHMHTSQLMNNEACGIRDVWAANLEDEFKVIRQLVTKYCYVAMDTEFPGVVARPIGEFRSSADYQYQLLKCNVDLLKIIQLGLTFLDENGKTPPGYSTWQFNFKFNLTEDMYAQDSIDLLQNSGIQFKKHEEEGIDIYEFAQLLMTSGIVLMDDVKWLSFHSGYDFGYLLKLLTDQNLPTEESEFFELLRIYFPTIYDVKYLMKSCKNLKGGLQEVAEQLELERIGPQHQAGSDSLLTGAAFFKMREVISQSEFIELCSHSVGQMLESDFMPKFGKSEISKSTEACHAFKLDRKEGVKCSESEFIPNSTKNEKKSDLDFVSENIKTGFMEMFDKWQLENTFGKVEVGSDDFDRKSTFKFVKNDDKYANEPSFKPNLGIKEGCDTFESKDALAFKLIFGKIKDISESEMSVFLASDK